MPKLLSTAFANIITQTKNAHTHNRNDGPIITEIVYATLRDDGPSDIRNIDDYNVSATKLKNANCHTRSR